MTIRELKTAIINHTLDDRPLVLKHTNNRFICNQYAHEIAKFKNLTVQKIEHLSEAIQEASCFDTAASILYVIDVSKFDEHITTENRNVIVIAEKIPSDLTIDFIDIPALVNWQIEDYVMMRLPGLTKAEIQWICNIAKYDIYRIDQECQKLTIFPKNMQSIIFNSYSHDGGYNDLNPLVIFDFTSAIMSRNMPIIEDVLNNLYAIDIEATGIVTILIKQFKTLIDSNFSSSWNSNLGCSEKQFYYFKSHPNKQYSNKQIIAIYDFLTSVDYELKSGNLMFDSDNRINNALATSYIVSKVLTM